MDGAICYYVKNKGKKKLLVYVMVNYLKWGPILANMRQQHGSK
jgi:hypothetical protein